MVNIKTKIKEFTHVKSNCSYLLCEIYDNDKIINYGTNYKTMLYIASLQVIINLIGGSK